MGAAYSQDLRDRVLKAYDRGMASKQIADLFAVSRAWVRRVKQRRRENGQISPRPMGGLRVVKIDLEQLRTLVAQTPDTTIKELHRQLQCGGTKCCESAVGMAARGGWDSLLKKDDPCGRAGSSRRSPAPHAMEKGATRSGSQTADLY